MQLNASRRYSLLVRPTDTSIGECAIYSETDAKTITVKDILEDTSIALNSFLDIARMQSADLPRPGTIRITVEVTA